MFDSEHPMRENNLKLLCSVLKIDLVLETEDGELLPFSGMVEDSPLMKSEELRTILRAGVSAMKGPYIYQGVNECYFASLHAGADILYLGPMCHMKLNTVKRRQMARAYRIESEDLREFPAFTLPEIRNMVLLTSVVLDNTNIEDEELLHLNRLINDSGSTEKQEEVRFLLKEEGENDNDAIRHSYHEEQQLMSAIREGRTAEAIAIAESMDRDSGRLSREEIRHRRNLAIVGISLCARAAIEGGITPEAAYRISGFYIQKCDSAESPASLLQYRNQAIEDLTARVKEKLDRSHSSSYVERCQDYIRKHYREKIYLDDIADTLGISPTYLSRLFRKETGVCIQDFINEERVFRAANLLAYSDLSIPAIGAYVNFPNQSYFGKIFKKYKNMTPKKYRDRYTVREIVE